MATTYLEDGTYRIVSCLGSSSNRCMLSACDTQDAINQEVRIAGESLLDKVIAHVRTIDTANHYQVVSFALAGTALGPSSYDEGGIAGLCTRTWNSSADLRFVISSDGSSDSSIWYGGTYLKYKMHNVSKNRDVKALGSSAGSGIGLVAAANESAQRWLFIPYKSVSDGVYTIHTPLDSTRKSVIAPMSAPTTNGCNVGVKQDDGTNAMRWIVSTSYDSSDPLNANNGVTFIKNVQSGKVWDIDGVGSAWKLANIQLWDKDGGNDERWLIGANGTITYNGESVSGYLIRNMAGTGGTDYVADYIEHGGKYTDPDTGKTCESNVALYSRWGGSSSVDNRIAQVWEFHPAEILDSGIQAPSAMGASTATDGKKQVGSGGTIASTTTGTNHVYPTWYGSSTQYQLRYTYRTRKAGSNWPSWPSTLSWKGTNGSTDNWGWGVYRSPSANITAAGGRYTWTGGGAPSLSPNTSGGTDAVEYRFEVRGYSASSGQYEVPAHGPSSTWNVRVVYNPLYTVTGISLTPNGLAIAYTSDVLRSGKNMKITAVTIDGRKALKGSGWTELLNGSSGTVIIPPSQLKMLPNEGSTVKLEYQCTSIDDLTRGKQTVSKTCTYGGGSLTISATATIDSMKMVGLSVTGTYDKLEAWAVPQGGTWDDSTYVELVNGSAKIPVAFGTPVTLWVMGYRGDNWGVWTQNIAAIDEECYALNYQVNGTWHWARILVNKDETPRSRYSTTPEYDSQQTNGSDWEVTHFGFGSKQEITLEGVLVNGYPSNNPLEEFDLLVEQGHYAWYRTPRGQLFRVAVTSLSVDESVENTQHYTEISLVMRRVS